MIWHNPKTNLPLEADNVLVAVRGEAESAEAFRIDEQWIYSTGHNIEAGKVYAWADLPKCPVELEDVR